MPTDPQRPRRPRSGRSGKLLPGILAAVFLFSMGGGSLAAPTPQTTSDSPASEVTAQAPAADPEGDALQDSESVRQSLTSIAWANVVIWTGLFLYLLRLSSKLRKMEKES